jgi:ketopantoate reductase
VSPKQQLSRVSLIPVNPIPRRKSVRADCCIDILFYLFFPSRRNACWNAVTTATQLRTNRFLEASPYALDLSRSIMGEVVQVAKAKGLTVPEGTIDKLIEQCTSVKGGLPSSMLFDYLAGRPMEVEVRMI